MMTKNTTKSFFSKLSTDKPPVVKKQNFHAKGVDDVLKDLRTGFGGLTPEEVKKRIETLGPNELPEKEGESIIRLVLRQFHSIFIYVLFAAAAISLFIGNVLDFYVIIVVIFFNAAIGFIEEYRAEKAIEKLKAMLVIFAKVYRGGELIKVPMRDLVPGDVIFLTEGDKVPADVRLLEVKDLETDEASLTGESLPVAKECEVLKEGTPLADRRNMAWLGTSVIRGETTAVVTNTGLNTVIGGIAESVARKKEKSHLERRVSKLVIQMGVIATAGAVFTFLVGFYIRELVFFEIAIFSLASLISGIPEGLPAILAVVMAIGVNRMARKKSIIRRLPVVETLAVATVIATDKTGTLTENTLTVEKIFLPEGDEVKVSGSGWDPAGAFFIGDEVIHPLQHLTLSRLLHIVAVTNKGRILKQDSQKKEDEEQKSETMEKQFEILGNPTEAALTVVAEKAGLKKDLVLEAERILDELPFDSEKKYRAVLVEHDKKRVYIVGAFENIINWSTSFLKDNSEEHLKPSIKDDTIRKAERMASDGMRILAVAYREVDKRTKEIKPEIVKDLTLVGMVAMRDLPREGVKKAIEKAKLAGLRIIMNTGDHKNTAVAIAKQVGLIEKDAHISEVALTEADIVKMSEEEFEIAVKEKTIFARVTPATKLRIVEILQKQGEIVAVTGDGVNDAPAIRKSDIGIAMGQTGTDVTREVSEMVLADDNFASIVDAIEEGRIVFNNIRQASFYLVTTSVAEDVTIITTLLLAMPLPLLPIHILWLNLITGGIPGIALASEPGSGYELDEPPKKSKENILSRGVIPFLIIISGLMTFGTIWLFGQFIPMGIEKARTVAFTAMAFFQLFNAFNMRSLKHSLFKIGFWSNKILLGGFLITLLLQIAIIYIPVFQKAFHLAPLSLFEWFIIMLVSSSVLWVSEAYKVVRGKLSKLTSFGIRPTIKSAD